jgi:hypothetical protein
MTKMERKRFGKSDDVWCDMCDSYVGDTYDIDAAKRLVCGRCLRKEVPKARSSFRVMVTNVSSAVEVEV